MHDFKKLCFSLLVLAVTTVSAQGAGNDNMPPPPPPGVGVEQFSTATPLEKIAPGRYRLGDIVIDKATRTVEFPAQVNMDKGLLEYLIVHRRGKTHESLLRTDISPYNLQIAFMLLGFEITDKPLAMQGATERPTGEAVSVSFIRGKDAGSPVPADAWIVTKTTMDGPSSDTGTIAWVYTGSFVDLGRFMAEQTGQIAAIYHDPVAMIDNASPGGESDKIWFVNEMTVPPVGTAVTVIIKPSKK